MTKENTFKKSKQGVERIKESKPLVLNITNEVTMDFIANGLLSLGASPVMSKAQQEAEDLLQLADAVVINIGTLDEKFITFCEHVCEKANQLKKAIILDPVGAGASRYRTDVSRRFIENYHIAIVRGNASEIQSMVDVAAATKGVDSAAHSEQAVESAKILSKKYDVAVVISGRTDFIVDGERLNQFQRGSSLMPAVTGTGCLLSAVVGAFHAVEKDRFEAASMAALFYSVCGERAEKKSAGPGSFRLHFLDALHHFPEYEEY